MALAGPREAPPVHKTQSSRILSQTRCKQELNALGCPLLTGDI
jgi:hypothetical protein